MTENPEMTAGQTEDVAAETMAVEEPKAAKKAAPKKAAAKAKAPATPKAAKAAATHDASRGRRKVREGVVVSNRMEKTVVVMVQRRTAHPLYGKVVIRSNKFKAHDEQSCDIGDRVEIMETRPLSRDKRWRVTQILEKVK